VPKVNPDEVAGYKWMQLDVVKVDIDQNPEIYTEWFKIIFKEFYNQLM
jgi:isopentenyl-diphosphate delta-isomerase